MSRQRVGWIGVGRIGLPMAHRVLSAGWPMSVWARRPDASEPLLAAGVLAASSPEDLAQTCDIVCTIVGGTEDVTALHGRMMPAARPGTLFIDMTTAAPRCAALAQHLSRLHGLAAIDAPLTGGVAGARQGTLTAFAGGDAATIERSRAVLQSFCQRIEPCGPPGSGYRTKLLNQTLVAGVLTGLADSARMARSAGLDAARLQSVLSAGTGGSFLLPGYLPRMMGGEGAVTFTLGLLRKDLQLARDEAAEWHAPAPLLDAALSIVDAAIERHGAAAGVQMLAQ